MELFVDAWDPSHGTSVEVGPAAGSGQDGPVQRMR
jgi:hypothetical protein